MTESIILRAALPALLFIGFVLLTLGVRPGDTPRKNAVLRAVILCFLGACLVAGISGKNLWPFAPWRYVSYSVGDTGNFVQAVGVGGDGREHRLDARAFEPLEGPELLGYLDNRLERMEEAQRAALLQFLLKHLQEALVRAQQGRPIGTFARILGPFSAPVFQVAAPAWARQDALPERLVGLRIYRVYWRISGSDARIERKMLVAEARS